MTVPVSGPGSGAIVNVDAAGAGAGADGAITSPVSPPEGLAWPSSEV